MSIKIERSLSSNNIQSISASSFECLADELILKIFKYLDFKNYLSARKVCHQWKIITDDPTIVFSCYLQEINTINSLSFLLPRFSAWEPMPRHWGLITQQQVLKFSSINEDIIAFHPPFCRQSSKFFSFTSQLPQFSDRCIFLGRHGSTYFLTPQGQTQLLLEVATDLQLFASHRLVTANINDPTKNLQFSLLKNLPFNTDVLSRSQIQDCFPISETKTVVLTRGGEVSLWDLSTEVPSCYKKVKIEPVSEVYQAGNYLISNNKIANLCDLEFTEHGFNFEDEDVIVFASSLCTYNDNRKEIRYFILNDKGVLEKKWGFNSERLLEPIEQKYGRVLSFYIKDMNEEFIVLECWQSQVVNLIILSTKGKLIHCMKHELPQEELDASSLRRYYPTFAHLSGNVLTYKDPLKTTIYFWHIPIKKYIQKFEWTKLIYDLPLSLREGLVQDIRLSEGKLTILLSSGHTLLSNKPGKYCLIQFNPQYKQQSSVWKMVNTVSSTAKAIYYAFPGNFFLKKLLFQ